MEMYSVFKEPLVATFERLPFASDSPPPSARPFTPSSASFTLGNKRSIFSGIKSNMVLMLPASRACATTNTTNVIMILATRSTMFITPVKTDRSIDYGPRARNERSPLSTTSLLEHKFVRKRDPDVSFREPIVNSVWIGNVYGIVISCVDGRHGFSIWTYCDGTLNVRTMPGYGYDVYV